MRSPGSRPLPRRPTRRDVKAREDSRGACRGSPVPPWASLGRAASPPPRPPSEVRRAPSPQQRRGGCRSICCHGDARRCAPRIPRHSRHHHSRRSRELGLRRDRDTDTPHTLHTHICDGHPLTLHTGTLTGTLMRLPPHPPTHRHKTHTHTLHTSGTVCTTSCHNQPHTPHAPEPFTHTAHAAALYTLHDACTPHTHSGPRRGRTRDGNRPSGWAVTGRAGGGGRTRVGARAAG